ncbi:hypothetical protein CAEBREN_12062 [Caenorhabditis brenneri]|uniref:Uncharacterized protein n=1 Tax=Caenorhabditis brenneri TaxID=135651 RepID=G0N950_CAEBE|nr:hypothetical protein CAEBREN_12062 [Caenorhabditis brenneri]
MFCVCFFFFLVVVIHKSSSLSPFFASSTGYQSRFKNDWP